MLWIGNYKILYVVLEETESDLYPVLFLTLNLKKSKEKRKYMFIECQTYKVYLFFVRNKLKKSLELIKHINFRDFQIEFRKVFCSFCSTPRQVKVRRRLKASDNRWNLSSARFLSGLGSYLSNFLFIFQLFLCLSGYLPIGLSLLGIVRNLASKNERNWFVIWSLYNYLFLLLSLFK